MTTPIDRPVDSDGPILAAPDGSIPKPNTAAPDENRHQQEDLFNLLQKAVPIDIDDRLSFFVDPETGEFQGPISEGTTCIIIFSGNRMDLLRHELGRCQAIRIPRLLQLEELLNFHVAEIAYHEGEQATLVGGLPSLPNCRSLNTRVPNFSVVIPGTRKRSCFIGFYLSLNSKYRLALLAADQAWPKDFADYLEAKHISHGELYHQLEEYGIEQAEAPRRQEMLESLVFIPDSRSMSSHNQMGNNVQPDAERQELTADSDHPLAPPMSAPGTSDSYVVFGRSQIVNTWSKKDMGGWWFNIPAYIYDWMSADLERLLTGLVDDDEITTAPDVAMHEPRVQSISSWAPLKWFQLFEGLSMGLYELHNAGFIHGDVRPANIMARLTQQDQIEPAHFEWIDVGLGYGHRLQSQAAIDDQGEELTVPPTPLGGGRVTPFYAPERIESVEFEDADIIRLRKLEDGMYEIRFFWKKRTYEEPNILRLRKHDGTPLRELGTLEYGDRIQFREYIFDVFKVETDRLIASRLYEVVMDRVLIAHEAQYIDEVIAKKLQSVAISRYRIFKQWGEATDIYGLGILVLYVFFLRGFFIRRVRSQSTPSQPSMDSSRRDSIFQSIVALLRNPSFVKAFLATLRGTQFDTKEKLWRTEVVQAGSMDASATPDDSGENTPYSRVIKIVEDFMFGMDNNLKYILYGVNSNYGLFMLTIHFSLSCMWRTSELSETDLEPYCQSRLKIDNTQLRGQPASRAKEDLVLIQNLIVRGIENYNEAIPEYVDMDDRPPGDHDSLTVNLDLIDENTRLKSEKRLLEDKVKQLKEVYDNQRFELNREKQNIQDLSHTNVEKLESSKNEEIATYAARVKDLQQQIAALQKPKNLFSRFSSGR